MTELIDAQNIGKVLEIKLQSLGINSLEALQELGTEEAFKLLKGIDKKSSRAILLSIEGAVSNVRWHNIKEDRRKELRDFYDTL